MRDIQMREKTEKLVACPISCSSNNDEYNDICKATGKPCPYFIDEGMSVCKSKAKCLAYFAKKGSGINMGEVAKLIASDTKSYAGRRRKYTNTIKKDKSMQAAELQEAKDIDESFLEGLEEALKTHSETSTEDVPEEMVAEVQMSAIERYKKKK